ncbi:MAG: hypothetical protein U0V74_01830 [Chitinophagales bacterium]
MRKKILFFLSSGLLAVLLFSCNQSCPPCPEVTATTDSTTSNFKSSDTAASLVQVLLTRKYLFCNEAHYGEVQGSQQVQGKDRYNRSGYHWIGYGVPREYFGQKCDPNGGDNATLVYGAAVWQEISDGGGGDSIIIVLPSNK